MEFNQLESFVNIADLRSFSKAAKKMYVTQPTITNNIQNLEKELGTKIIDRSSKNIVLTESGEILYKYANDMINMRDRALYAINNKKGEVEGNLEICTSSIPEQYILPHIIKEFSSIFPKITFTIKHRDSKQVIEDIMNGYVNYGIVGARYDRDSLQYIDFCDDTLVLAVPNNRDYLLEAYEEVDIDFLTGQKLILREEGSGSRLKVEEALQSIGMNPRSLNVVSSIECNETIKKMVELGVGISFISEMAIRNEIDLGLIKPYRMKGLDLTRKFYFVYHKSRYLSPIAEELKKYLMKCCPCK